MYPKSDQHLAQSWIARDLLDAWRVETRPQQEAAVGQSHFQVLSDSEKRIPIEELGNAESLDLLLIEEAVMPAGARSSDRRELPDPWPIVLKCLPSLSTQGAAFTIVGPAFPPRVLDELRAALQALDLDMSAVLRLPGGLHSSPSSLRPLLVIIQGGPREDLVVADLNVTTDVLVLTRVLLGKAEPRHIATGLRLPHSEFRSVDGVAFRAKATELAEQFSSYRTQELRDLVEQALPYRLARPWPKQANAVYVSRMPSVAVVAATDIAGLSARPQNYVFLGVRSKELAEYLAYYLSTDLGKASMAAMGQGATIQRVATEDLLSIPVAVPPPETMDAIVQADRVLRTLIGAAQTLHEDLASRPSAANELLLRGHDILEALDQLSDADRVRAMIRAGESARVEFKQTLSWCINKKEKSKVTEISAIKTVAGFMNAMGGTLLIGVADDQSVPGIAEELDGLYKDKGTDALLLHLGNLLNGKLGKACASEVGREVVIVDGQQVIMVTCPRAERAAWYEKKTFYVRQSPRTEALEGPELTEYHQRRFAGASSPTEE